MDLLPTTIPSATPDRRANPLHCDRDKDFQHFTPRQRELRAPRNSCQASVSKHRQCIHENIHDILMHRREDPSSAMHRQRSRRRCPGPHSPLRRQGSRASTSTISPVRQLHPCVSASAKSSSYRQSLLASSLAISHLCRSHLCSFASANFSSRQQHACASASSISPPRRHRRFDVDVKASLRHVTGLLAALFLLSLVTGEF